MLLVNPYLEAEVRDVPCWTASTTYFVPGELETQPGKDAIESQRYQRL